MRSKIKIQPPRPFCGGSRGRLLARIQTEKSGRSQSVLDYREEIPCNRQPAGLCRHSLLQ